jgi:hypothetical protein
MWLYDVSLDGQHFLMVAVRGEAHPGGPILVRNWREELRRLMR